MTASVRVYVSGPMSLGDRAANVQRGIDAADWFLDRGVAALCPMYSHHPQARPCEPGTATYERVVASDLGWVEVADAVLLLPGESRGAARECDHARRVGVPVFTDRTECLVYLMGLKALRKFVARLEHDDRPSAAGQGGAETQIGGAPHGEQGPSAQGPGGAQGRGSAGARGLECSRARVAHTPHRYIKQIARSPAARSRGRA